MTNRPIHRDRTWILCADPNCHKPCAKLVRDEAGVLWIEIQVRHHGRNHITRLTVDELPLMLPLEPLPSA